MPHPGLLTRKVDTVRGAELSFAPRFLLGTDFEHLFCSVFVDCARCKTLRGFHDPIA